MTVALEAPVGSQTPRITSVPDYVSTTGAEAIELAEMAGLVLDPWQRLVLTHSLGERPDGSWAAFEVGLVLSRQNGKDSVIEARELAGLFLLGERLLIHSAHQFDTSLEHFRRLLYLIENTPDFDRRVRRVTRSHGEEGIELKGGQRIRFRTRTKGGGRGFSGDLLVFNEAMFLPEMAHGALLPTLSARKNPQVWYAGSVVDQFVHEHGLVLTRIRKRGIEGGDPRLAYFEWSLDRDNPADVDTATASDPTVWADANPALGIRISTEHVEAERRSMDHRTFAVERLGVGDWPNLQGADHRVISEQAWADLADPASRLLDPVCFAYDVTPDRSWASISAAGRRSDGLAHVETVERRRGTGWVVQKIVALAALHEHVGVVCDGSGPAASLAHELEAEGVKVTLVSAKDHANACGGLFDKVQQRKLRHLGAPELAAAVKGATRRPLGDAWAWSRKTSAVDISPLVGGTLALWGAETLDGMGADLEALWV